MAVAGQPDKIKLAQSPPQSADPTTPLPQAIDLIEATPSQVIIETAYGTVELKAKDLAVSGNLAAAGAFSKYFVFSGSIGVYQMTNTTESSVTD